MSRLTAVVVKELLDEMHRVVRDYDPTVGRTGRNIQELIAGTAMFPGGAGLWRGAEPFGALPEWFPDSPVMLVGHNFDSVAAHERARRKGGEAESFFWQVLRGFLNEGGVLLERCFFTNALMGLKPGSAVGPMPSVAGYEQQCQAFLARQIEIVVPQAVFALGYDAARLIAKVRPRVRCEMLMHPSAREFKPLATRPQRIAAQGEKIRHALSGLANDR